MSNPVIENGQVKGHYVKTGVSKKHFNNYYSYHPCYVKLDERDNFVVVGFLRPKYNEPLPHHLTECNSYEVKKINPELESPR